MTKSEQWARFYEAAIQGCAWQDCDVLKAHQRAVQLADLAVDVFGEREKAEVEAYYADANAKLAAHYSKTDPTTKAAQS